MGFASILRMMGQGRPIVALVLTIFLKKFISSICFSSIKIKTKSNNLNSISIGFIKYKFKYCS